MNDERVILEPEVIYEDQNFLVLNKPAGLLVHKTGVRFQVLGDRGEGDTLVSWLLKHYPEVRKVGDDPETRPGIAHRLDRDTSGVMVVARNQKYFEYLKSLFKNHQIEKTYLALVFGKLAPMTGTINKPIGIKSGTTKRTIFSKKLIKDAVTEYKVLKYLERNTSSAIVEEVLRFSLVEVRPRTGRTHQIRVHLASLGHPIVNDILYGGKKTAKIGNGRLMLHALSLEFESETGKRARFEAEPPEDFERVIANIAN